MAASVRQQNPPTNHMLPGPENPLRKADDRNGCWIQKFKGLELPKRAARGPQLFLHSQTKPANTTIANRLLDPEAPAGSCSWRLPLLALHTGHTTDSAAPDLLSLFIAKPTSLPCRDPTGDTSSTKPVTMSNTMRDLIQGEAELDDDEDDESFDEDTGEARPRARKAHVQDSSDDEDEDDDEEEARKVGSSPAAWWTGQIDPHNFHRCAKASLSRMKKTTTRARTRSQRPDSRSASATTKTEKKRPSSTKKTSNSSASRYRPGTESQPPRYVDPGPRP